MTKKKPMKMYSKEEIKKAEQVDIVSFIQSYGKGELVGGGRYPKYQINGHHTIVIDRKRNGFYHNGQSKGNNIIGLLTQYEGYRFTEAVGLLLGEEIDAHVPYDNSDELEEEYHYQYEKDTALDRAKNYLVNERGIDPEIFNYLVDHDYLIQDKKFKSAIFHWKEFGLPDGETVGATSIVTGKRKEGSSGKYIMKTSKKHYGFNVTIGQPKKIYFFEASIDLLSYWSMNKDLEDARLVCMEGLKDRTVLSFLEESYREFQLLPSDGIFYGVDNDAAGHRFYDKIDRDVNIRQSMDTDKVILNTALITHDLDIPKDIYETIREVSLEKNVDWKLVTSALKIENNLTDSEKIANGFNLYGNFSKSDLEADPERKINLAEQLEKFADRLIQEDISLVTIDKLYANEKHSELDIESMKQRFSTYYHHLSEERYQVVEHSIKDWNDELIVEKQRGTTRSQKVLKVKEMTVPTDSISASKIQDFTYYLQDSQDWTIAGNRLTNTYQVDPTLVQALMKKGMIRQDENNRIVYLWTNKGAVIGGQVTGTIENKSYGRGKIEKGILNLSQPGYGFNFTLGEPKEIYFFHSPEDLLSYWSLNKDTLKNVTLFSLSDDSPQSLIQIINERIEAGASFEKIHIAINHNKAGTELLDGVSMLDAFDRQEKSLSTVLGNLIPIQSERPIVGSTWQEENIAKKERVARLREFHQLNDHLPIKEQQAQQQAAMSQGR